MQHSDLPEREYSDSYYEQAFSSYYEGLLLRDPQQVLFASNIIDTIDKPEIYITDVVTYGEGFQRILRGDYPENEIHGYVDNAAFNGIRANIYSGVPLNRPAILTAVDLLGWSAKDLYETIAPGRAQLRTLNPESESERRTYQILGRQALRNMSFLPGRLSLLRRKI